MAQLIALHRHNLQDTFLHNIRENLIKRTVRSCTRVHSLSIATDLYLESLADTNTQAVDPRVAYNHGF